MSRCPPCFFAPAARREATFPPMISGHAKEIDQPYPVTQSDGSFVRKRYRRSLIISPRRSGCSPLKKQVQSLIRRFKDERISATGQMPAGCSTLSRNWNASASFPFVSLPAPLPCRFGHGAPAVNCRIVSRFCDLAFFWPQMLFRSLARQENRPVA